MSERFDKLKQFAEQLSKSKNFQPEGVVDKSVKFSIKDNEVSNVAEGGQNDTSFICSIATCSGSGIVVDPRTMLPTICLPSICVRIEAGQDIGEDDDFMREYDFRLLVHPVSAAVLYLRLKDYMRNIGVDPDDREQLVSIVEKATEAAHRVDLDDIGNTFPQGDESPE